MSYFIKTGANLFCQDYLIQEALKNTNQFLSKLDEQVDFEKMFREKLVDTYKGKCTLGPPSYKPELVLKMLFLAYLFNKSEREIERIVNDSISMKVFLGISLDEASPDHSTLTKFKNRILKYQELQEYQGNDRDIFKEVFDEVVSIAIDKNIDLGYTQSIDSTHTVADVNTNKDNKRKKKISNGGQGKSSRDKDSKWGVKRIKEVKAINGIKVKIKESYYGYKNHFSVNTKTNLITSYRVTRMNAPDNHSFLPLMQDDIAQGFTKEKKTCYTADKAYDDGELHAWLNQQKFKNAIDLKYTKTENKTENGHRKVKWTQYTTQEDFENGLAERYTVERVNADVKKWHGLHRSRYLGIAKMNIQTSLTTLAHNLKTLVKIWTGVGLRTPLPVHVSLG